MAKLYSVSCTVTWKEGDWTCSRQVPTFILNANVQGIRDCADAEAIARKICMGANVGGEAVSVNANAVEWLEV